MLYHVKHIVTVLVGFILAGSASSQAVIVWDSARKLSWADFQGNADRESQFNAVTVSGIYYKFDLGPGGYRDSIMAVFFTAESWVKDSSESQLIHEQGHFDITEIFARILRKRRMEFIPGRGSLGRQLKTLYDGVERERDAMEIQYDRQTGHSANAAMQRFWNLKIRNELQSLDQYAY